MSHLKHHEDGLYSQILDLDKLRIFHECDPDQMQGPTFFEVNYLPEILSYGKHYFTIGFIDPPDINLRLKESTNVLFEFKDADGTVLLSDITELNHIDGKAVCYVWIKEDPLRTYKPIKSGEGTLTIVGELEGVPTEWQGKYNVRLKMPVEIRPNLPNTSPILFQNINKMQTSASTEGLVFSESIHADTDTSTYKRSYINISSSNLETYGGKVDKIELSYREDRSRNNEYTILTTYPLSSSIYELKGGDTTATKGLNPISDIQKFPVPPRIRRTGKIYWKLRFLNPHGEYAQDITQNDTDIAITGSNNYFSGSQIVVDSQDGLFVTGSGTITFGKEEGTSIRYNWNEKAQKVKADFYEDGLLKRNVATFQGEDGRFIQADDTNIITGSTNNALTGDIARSAEHSAIVGASGSIISGSSRSFVTGKNNKIFRSDDSAIIGGQESSIIQETSNVQGSMNVIVGSSYSDIKSVIGGSTSPLLETIVGGQYNKIEIMPGGAHTTYPWINTVVGASHGEISSSNITTIVGGVNQQIRDSYGSVIVGGLNNTITSSDYSAIIGGQNITATADNTVYTPNLHVSGSLTVTGAVTSSIVSSSVIYSSGSNIFGDEDSDIHRFNGKVGIQLGSSYSPTYELSVSGSISASGEIKTADLVTTDDVTVGDDLTIEGITEAKDLVTIRKWLNIDDTSNSNPTIWGLSYTDLDIDDEAGITIEDPNATIRLTSIQDPMNPKIDFVRGSYKFAGNENDADWRIIASGSDRSFDNQGSGFSYRNEGFHFKNIWSGHYGGNYRTWMSCNARNNSVLIGHTGFTSASKTYEMAPRTMATSSLMVEGDLWLSGSNVGGNISASGDLYVGDTSNYMHYDHSERKLIIDSTYDSANENYFEIKKAGSIIFEVDEDGDVTADGQLTAGPIKSSTGYYYGTDADSKIIIARSGQGGKIEFCVNPSDGWDANQVVIFDDDKLDIGTVAQDTDVGLANDALFVDYGQATVGIGTTSPTKKLQVTGDTEFSSSIIHNSASVGTTTQKGMFTVHYGAGQQLTGSLSNAGDGYGDIISSFHWNATVTPGSIVYLRQNTGDWRLASADNENTTGGTLMGISLNDPDVLVRGFVKLTPITGSSNTHGGAAVYVSEIPGSGSFHAPPSGDTVRVAGFTVATGSDDIIYFNPDNSWVVRS